MLKINEKMVKYYFIKLKEYKLIASIHPNVKVYSDIVKETELILNHLLEEVC